MRAALAAHDEVLRQAIEAHAGWLFKHTGDGVCAAFASPRSAVDAAVAAQRALELPVRMGLATGEAELRDSDYFGTVLNRAARVMATGHGGQILLADSTAGLLSGVDLLDLGPRRLRDLPMPIGVYQVRADGLRTDFPPLRALDSSPGNLPRATTSFIGRESEADEVQAAVKAHRLVTLTGVGGVGKTRLALEVAARLVDEFPDGVWLFELAAVTDPAAVPDAVAAVLGITQQPGKTVAESVAAALEGRVRLLVFDNCEHLLDAAGELIEAILAAAPTIKILATSREGLGVADEQLWPVASLEVGAGVDSAAVSLFIERAQAVSPRFSVTSPAEVAAVVEICRRLDGIPLAIELAASRMASMTAARCVIGSISGSGCWSGRGAVWNAITPCVTPWRGPTTCSTTRKRRCWIGVRYSPGDSTSKVPAPSWVPMMTSPPWICSMPWCASRCWSPTGLRGGPGFRCWRRSANSPRNNSSPVAKHPRFGPPTRATSPDAKPTSWPCGTAPANGRPTTGSLSSWPICAPRFAGPPTTAISMSPPPSPAMRGGSALLVQTLEPIAWAEELIEPARVADHPRLAFLYVIASLCYSTGRIEAAVRYSDAGQIVVGNSREAPPYGIEAALGSVYLVIGQPERMAELCRAQLARRRDTHVHIRAWLVAALHSAGSGGEAMDSADGLIEAAETTGNPLFLAWALGAYGLAFRDADPVGALNALGRGLVIAQDSGNRTIASVLANGLARLEAEHGDTLAAFDHLTLAIRGFHNAGDTTTIRVPLAILAALFDRLGRYEPAATIAGFALSPLAASAVPEITTAITHLRDVLGDRPTNRSPARVRR